jgi:outer membrane protein OmpA-like peptidoglycan-associated protein
MANSQIHEKDTRIAVKGTTSPDNIELIVNAVYFVVDGTYERSTSSKGFETLDYLLEHLKRYGITEESLYNDLINTGISPDEINKIDEKEKKKLYSNKKAFLQIWLLPSAQGENKHQYTHKGFDYNYDKKEEDGSWWSGKEKHQSWMVKRKLLVDIIKNVYSISPADAEKIAGTLYFIHCLRDLRCCNVDVPQRREYLFDLPKEIKKYTIPIIKSNDLLKKVTEDNDKIIKSIDNSKAADKWDDNLWDVLDNFLGKEESYDGGLLSKVIPEFLKPEAPTGLKAEVLSDSEISLTWNGQKKDGLHYNLYIGESPDSLKKAEIKDLKEPRFKVENLEADTTYYFAVTCCSFEMESEKSKIVSARTKNKKIIVAAPLKKSMKGKGSGTDGPPPTPPPINFRIIGIIVGIILLILLILFLLRNCHGCSGNTGNPSPPKGPEPTRPEPTKSEPTRSEPPTKSLVFDEKTEKLFVANSSELLPDASKWLDETARKLSEFIKEESDATFKVTGYAAVFPGLPDPVELSRERANKIISELGARDINANKLQAFSGGETDKWGNNIDEATRAPNRRIVIQQK